MLWTLASKDILCFFSFPPTSSVVLQVEAGTWQRPSFPRLLPSVALSLSKAQDGHPYWSQLPVSLYPLPTPFKNPESLSWSSFGKTRDTVNWIQTLCTKCPLTTCRHSCVYVIPLSRNFQCLWQQSANQSRHAAWGYLEELPQGTGAWIFYKQLISNLYDSHPLCHSA